MATLEQSQAAYEAQKRESEINWAELDRKTEECFARIMAQLGQITRVLEEQTRLLERLPDLICEKLGIQIPQ